MYHANLNWFFCSAVYSKYSANIHRIKRNLKEIIQTFIQNYEHEVDLLYIVKNSSEFIEKNPNILKYSDMSLYDHQKEIYTSIRARNPKLILYIAVAIICPVWYLSNPNKVFSSTNDRF